MPADREADREQHDEDRQHDAAGDLRSEEGHVVQRGRPLVDEPLDGVGVRLLEPSEREDRLGEEETHQERGRGEREIAENDAAEEDEDGMDTGKTTPRLRADRLPGSASSAGNTESFRES